MFETNSMHDEHSVIDLYKLEEAAAQESNTAQQRRPSPFPSVESVLLELEETFDLNGLVA